MLEPLCRLRRRVDFLRIVRRGRKWVAPAFVLFLHAQHQPGGTSRAGLTVSRKVGNAVARNRVRRRLRALLRFHGAAFAASGIDLVLIARRSARRRAFAAMLAEFERALHQLLRPPPAARS